MIEHTQGNLLEADAEALVNAVNCVGVMGKGIALQFKQAFPGNFRQYKQACETGNMRLREVLVVATDRAENPLYIINFPTKYHWKEKSQLEIIRVGLSSLVREVRRLGIRSVAVPALGCGNGGLDWSEVKPLIETAFTELSDVHVLLFEPASEPQSGSVLIDTRLPKVSRTQERC
jgi:O-acetyl-ADP-ribose deacetylase (regulator of RNase III)